MKPENGVERGGMDWGTARARLAAADAALARQTNPNPQLAREILERRASALAAPPKETALPAGLLQLVVFSLRGQRYGVEDGHVLGVARLERLSPVPGAPSGIAGITMFLGDLLPVADLCVLLGISPSTPGEYNSLLILADDGLQLGIMVEEFNDMATAGAGEVKPVSPAAAGDGTGLIRGVTPDGTIVINTQALLAHPDLGPRISKGNT